VVVATHRRHELLSRCLRALLDQDFKPGFEVIVVDDACSPTTAGVLEAVQASRTAQRAPVTLLPGRRRGPATARNTGWHAARGDIVAFTDDDAFPADDQWLARGFRWFEDPAVNAVSGAVVVPAGEPPTDYQRNVKRLEQGEFLTCNAFYRRSALEAVQGFDERFTVPFREDSDLQYRVEGLGGRMIAAPDAVVVHPAPRGSFAASLRLQRYSQFNALMYRKHPGRYRTRLQPQPPLHYYGIVASGAVAFGALLTRRRLVGLGFGALWAVMESRFFLRRVRGTSRSPRHVLDMALTSLLIPPLSLYWRLRGAIKYRVLFF
jgi:cellulose synthase/poly-beta-1,6-N-acetylglucosamine synthase-like glycosyltransferase